MKVRHVSLVNMIRAFQRKTFNHFDMFPGKRRCLIEIIINNDASHAVMRNFSGLSGIEDVFSATPPSDEIICPDVMVPFLDFEVFRRHVCRFRRAVGGRRHSARHRAGVIRFSGRKLENLKSWFGSVQ